MKSDQRGKVVELLRRAIPRSASGDPAFEYLGLPEEIDPLGLSYDSSKTLLTQFSAAEIVVMCNRFLYLAEYQRGWHRRWERQKSEDLAPLKQRVVELYPELRSWTKATESQLKTAKASLDKEKENKVG
jgi:hypothetical protein